MVNSYKTLLVSVFVYISTLSYIYTNYIFLESTYNTDSHSKISAVGKGFEKNIFTYNLCNNLQRGISFESYCINKSIESFIEFNARFFKHLN